MSSLKLLVTLLSVWSVKAQLSDVLLLADNDLKGLYYVNISTQGAYTRLPTPTITGAYSVAYDPGIDTIFFAGYKPDDGNFVGRMKSDGSNFVYDLVPVVSRFYTLTLDTVSKVVYFADEGEHAIGVMSYDTRYRKHIITSFDAPTGLVLHHSQRKLYFASYSQKISTTNFVVADMDGDNQGIIYTVQGSVIIDMDIDRQANELYFVEKRALSTKIVKFNTVNLQRTDILTGNLAYGYLTIALNGYTMLLARLNNKTLERYIKDGSFGQRFGVAPAGNSTVYDMFAVTSSTRLTYTTGCSVNNGGCETFCLPTPQGRTCACTEGYKLQADNTCVKSPFTDFVMFSDYVRNGIFLIDLQTNVSKRLHYVGLGGVSGISYADGHVYWAHQTSEHIVRGCLNTTDNCGKILSFLNTGPDDQQVSKVEDIAIDPTNGNIFVVDSKRNLIFTIMNSTTFSMKMIESGLNEPSGLALDPFQRVMFWTDVSFSPRIERASMDNGGNRMVIVNGGLRLPLDVVADRLNKKIYWCDFGMMKIETANYDGTNREVAVTTPLPYTSLAVDANYIYFAHGNSRSVFRVTKSTGTGIQAIGPSAFHKVYDMTVVNLRAPPIITTQGQPKGFVMHVDAVAAAVWTTDLEGRSLTKLAIRNLQVPVACEYDPLNKQVFLLEHGRSNSQSSPKMVLRSSFDGSSQFLKRLPGNSKPYGLAVDMISQLVYYTDVKEKHLAVVSMDFRYYKVLLSDIDDLMFVGIDYLDGKMFYGAGGNGLGKIFSADGNGENVREIVSQDIGNLGEIAVDIVEKTIYWTDSQLHRVERCSYTGSGRRVLQDVSSGTRHIAIGLDDFYVYFSTYSDKQIFRFPKTGGTARPFGTFDPDTGEVTDICVYKPRQGSTESNACSVSNGGCNQMCLPTPSGRRCACDERYTLDTDQTTCILSPFEKILLATDKDRSGIFAIDVTTNAQYRLPMFNLNGVTGIGWDPKGGKFYWADTSYRTLSEGCLGRDCVDTVIQWTGIRQFDHLAVDYDQGFIYMVESFSRVIFRVSPITKVNKTIIATGSGKPRAIALDLTSRLLYWTDTGPTPKIERASMDDGSDRETIIDTNLNSPNDVVIDVSSSELFWCDGGTRRIEKSSLSGADRKTLITGNEIYLSITIDDTYLYYFGIGTSSIFRINKNTGGGLKAIGGKGLFHVFGMIYIDTTASSLPVTPRPPSSPSPSGGPPSSNEVSGGPGSMLPLYIGIGAGAAVLLVILIVVAIVCCCIAKNARKRASQVHTHAAAPKPGQENAVNAYQTLQVSQKANSGAGVKPQETYLQPAPVTTDPDTLAMVLLEQNQQNQAQMESMQQQLVQLQAQTLGMDLVQGPDTGLGEKMPIEDLKSTYEELPRSTPNTPDYINMRKFPPPYSK